MNAKEKNERLSLALKKNLKKTNFFKKNVKFRKSKNFSRFLNIFPAFSKKCNTEGEICDLPRKKKLRGIFACIKKVLLKNRV